MTRATAKVARGPTPERVGPGDVKRQIAWCLVDRAGTDGAVAVDDAAVRKTLQCAGVVTVARMCITCRLFDEKGAAPALDTPPPPRWPGCRSTGSPPRPVTRTYPCWSTSTSDLSRPSPRPKARTSARDLARNPAAAKFALRERVARGRAAAQHGHAGVGGAESGVRPLVRVVEITPCMVRSP